jgi:hypothetical protein
MPRRLILPFLVLGFVVSARPGVRPFTTTTANSGNSFTAAARFPTYPAAVTGDGAALLHRSDENQPKPAPMTAGVPGALQGVQQGQRSSTAVAFNGTTSAYNNTQVASPRAGNHRMLVQGRRGRRQLRRLLALGRPTDHRLDQPTGQRLPGRHARRGIRHLPRTHGTADRLALPRQPLT